MFRLSLLILLLFTTLSLEKEEKDVVSAQQQSAYADISPNFSPSDIYLLLTGTEPTTSSSILGVQRTLKLLYFFIPAKLSWIFLTKDCHEYYVTRPLLSYPRELIVFIKILRI
jgi:hypothetical protein